MINPEKAISIFKAFAAPSLVLQAVDPSFTITLVNNAYLNATKTTEADLLGKQLFEVFPDNPSYAYANGVSNLHNSLRTVIQSRQPHFMATHRYDLFNKSSGLFEERYWLTENVPVLNTEGAVELIIHTVKDVTDSVVAALTSQIEDKQVASHSEKLVNIEEVAEFGTWVLDLVHNRLSWSDGVFRMCGYPPQAFEVTFDKGLEVIHPDDRQHAIEHMQAALEKKQGYLMRKRLLTQDRQVRQVISQASVLLDEQGFPIKMIGVLKDVTEQLNTQKNLESTRKLFKSLVQTIDGIFWEADAASLALQYISPQVEKILGYTPQECMDNKQFWRCHIHPDDYARVMAYCTEQVALGLNHSLEYRLQTRAGDYRWVQDMVTVVQEACTPTLLRGLVVDIHEKRNLEQELAEQKLQRQKWIAEAQIQAQEKERNAIGCELHDNINQVLTSVELLLRVAIDEEAKRLSLLHKGADQLKYVIKEIRKLSHALVTPSLVTSDLQQALQQLVEEINLTGKLKAQLVFKGAASLGQDQQLQLMMYRVTQEQLNNVIKHAQASQVIITLEVTTAHVRLTVADNGVGFATSTKPKGIGLQNICSRVAYYQGCMRIDSAPGKGCRLHITIPLIPAPSIN